MIHIDEIPPNGAQNLHRVIAKEFDHESIDWIERHQPPISEAWIYDMWEGARVIAWYTEV